MTDYRLTLQVTTKKDVTYITPASYSFDRPPTREDIKEAEVELTKLQNVRSTTIVAWSPYSD